MQIADLAGKRVAIWGFGREGRAALGVLRRRLPEQALVVFCSEAEADFLGKLGLRLPAHGARRGRDAVEAVTRPPGAADLSAFDVVVKSPGISAYRAEIRDAVARGVRFTSGTALWFAERPASRVIAVTGTKGKSTTAALVAHLLRARGHRVALAGNIGLPLLDLLDAPEPDGWVVELSSFQTRDAGPVEVAVVTQLAEEHLDWHGSRARYVEDKLALADRARCVVVDAASEELVRRTATHPRRRGFGQADGWHVAGASLWRGAERMLDLARIPLPGRHNAHNVCAALAALEAAGEDARAALAHLAAFRPLPHRLQVLGERDGRTWIDDSIATTPQATLEALASVAGRAVCVLVGGHDRGLDWTGFVRAVRADPPAAIVTMGAVGARVHALLGEARCPVHAADSLADAVARARGLVADGGVVLLSPGAPSFDEFRDYAERGRTFAALAGFDAAAFGEIPGLGIA